MKIKLTFMSLTLILVLLISGCKENDYQPNVGVCPQVLSTIPANGAVNVPLRQVISVTFNSVMNETTITNTSFTITDETKSAELKAAVVLTGAITYSGKTAFFTPSVPLTPKTTYTGRVTTAVHDMLGSTLQADYVWTFSIDVSPTANAVPLNNAVNVPLNSLVVVNFSVPMDSLVLKAPGTYFMLKQGTTVVPGTYSFTSTSVVFKPTNSLAPFTVYSGTLTTAFKNSIGTPIATDYLWSFTTIPMVTLTSSPVAGGTTTGNGTFAQGSLVTVIATANPGFAFTNWMDGSTIVSTIPSYQFTMTGNKILVANFALITYNLNVTAVNGTVVKVPNATTYNIGAIVQLTATANSGYQFASWSGDATGSVNPLNVTMNSSKNITANFSLSTVVVPGGSIDLKSAAKYALLSGTGISNNAGFSVINNMDVGISPGARSSITGFPPAIVVGGALYAADDGGAVAAMLTLAKLDLTNAYLAAEGASAPAPVTVSGDQGGKTLAPGIYKSTSTLLIQSGNLTLDGQGDPNASWIFQIASGFTTVGGAGGSVILTGGAQAKNIFWQTGSSAVIGDYTTFYGNILALQSITLNSHATMVGRILCRNGAIVMTDTNIINKP